VFPESKELIGSFARFAHRPAGRGNEIKQRARRVEWEFRSFKAEFIKKSIERRLSEFRIAR
jgi:hypothetical protein